MPRMKTLPLTLVEGGGAMNIRTRIRRGGGLVADNLRTDWSPEADRRGTPQKLYDRLDDEFGFDLDLAADPAYYKHHVFLGPGSMWPDALRVRWKSLGEVGFLNPPFLHLAAFMIHAQRQWRRDRFVTVAVVSCKTEQPWAHRVCPAAEVRFLRGRLQYEKRDPRSGALVRQKGESARFPSMVVIIGSRGALGTGKGNRVIHGPGQTLWWDWRKDVYR